AVSRHRTRCRPSAMTACGLSRLTCTDFATAYHWPRMPVVRRSSTWSLSTLLMCILLWRHVLGGLHLPYGRGWGDGLGAGSHTYPLSPVCAKWGEGAHRVCCPNRFHIMRARYPAPPPFGRLILATG